MPGVTDVEARLAELGLELPPPPTALAAYVPVVVHEHLAFVAGQVPMVDGSLLHPGTLGENVSTEEGRDAARRAVLQSLSALRDSLGSFDRLVRIVKLDVFVASAPSFTDQPPSRTGRASCSWRCSATRGATRAPRSGFPRSRSGRASRWS
jgi:enamine deaminase RidA (YjgF/YER057c/UK114 family)